MRTYDLVMDRDIDNYMTSDPEYIENWRDYEPDWEDMPRNGNSHRIAQKWDRFEELMLYYEEEMLENEENEENEEK